MDGDWQQYLLKCAAADPEYQQVQDHVLDGSAWEFVLHQGLLYYAPMLEVKPRLYVPRAARQQVMQRAHDQEGHLGRDKTLDLLRRDFFWPSMAASVAHYLATCPKCQTIKSNTQVSAGPLMPLRVPDRCWEEVSHDLITKLPRTERGHDCLVVMVDRLSKRIILIPAEEKGLTADRYADLFVSNVFRHYGMPRALVSDRDPRFTSHLWRALCRRLGVQLKMSSAHHPETDGQTERANRSNPSTS
jgi:transposase InsO family protein